MREILNVMGNRKAVLARELTKVHEEILTFECSLERTFCPLFPER